ncbi:MAG: hypothetical protein QFX33_01000 [Candidatus Nezhaarchaeota archaeon]|nr:hypothetical protein [Candidatus Nezhaarchaeota archaeon]
MNKRKVVAITLAAAVAAIACFAVLNATYALELKNLCASDAGSMDGGALHPFKGFSGMRIPQCGKGLRGFCGFLEVSEEFKNKVMGIAESDGNVQDLLNDGYTVASIKPIVKAVVGEDGTVTLKATMAVVTLKKDAAGCAFVKVDVENAKVLEIEIHSKTVIQKTQ